MPTLRELGWSERLEAELPAAGASGLVPGRVSLEHTHIYRVLTEASEWLARVSGRLRHHAASRASFPAVGDWVGVEPPQDDGFARIRTVLPRASRFSRRSAGDRTEEQVVAPTSTSSFSSPGSTATTTRAASSATSSSLRTVAPRRSSC